jgi:hypothetical protein
MTYCVGRDPYGYAKSIDYDGRTVLHLVNGSVRNEEEVESVVSALNLLKEIQAALDSFVESVHFEFPNEIPDDERQVGVMKTGDIRKMLSIAERLRSLVH